MSTKEGSDRLTPPDEAPPSPRPSSENRAARSAATPEDQLERAMAASTADARARAASEGLANPEPIDDTTHAMLLRQLYLAHFEQEHFERAYELAQQAIAFEVLVDVLHQDAARARQALGDVDGAVQHLRLAARLAPPSRRAFHHWTLGSVLFLAGRHDEAIASLERASRWGTTDKPLYQGHLALAKCRAGHRVRNLDGLMARLEACPAGQGYGRFVLGQLAYQERRYTDARLHLTRFVERTRKGQPAMRRAMAGEVEMAEATLAELDAAS